MVRDMGPDSAGAVDTTSASGSEQRVARSGRQESELRELSRQECLELLAQHRFGRLAIVMSNGSPMIRPVNYVFDRASQSVVFRTARGSKFHALLRASRAAFEIDGIDEAARTGWSVIVDGVTAEVTTPTEIGRRERVGLQPWAPGPKPHWVRIRARTVSGRRIVLPDDQRSEKYLG
jgi:nitroimidazol reductase NimA-like FMN-containing flavoprotein (pyridoxamine 5'-phosphate oxidase superfamily)